MSSFDQSSWAEDAVAAARAGAEAFLSSSGAEARADGIRTALEATQRLGELFTRASFFGPSRGSEGFDEDGYRRFRAESERMFDAWIDVMRSSFTTMMSVADRAFLADRRQRADRTDAVRLGPVLPGESTASTLWVRNPTDSPLVGVVLGRTPLVSDVGDLITEDQLTLSRSEIDVIDPGSSRAVSVRLHTRADALPGVYRGAITSEAMPNALVIAEIVSAST
jgi:hypothetical protein